jgi:hypothetical protein
MKFDVILNHNSTRKFDKILFNGQNCILGTQRGLETDEHISVLNQDITYPSDNTGKVFYPVNKGDYITVCKRINGTIYADCYKVISITDTEVIGGIC